MLCLRNRDGPVAKEGLSNGSISEIVSESHFFNTEVDLVWYMCVYVMKCCRILRVNLSLGMGLGQMPACSVRASMSAAPDDNDVRVDRNFADTPLR